MSVSEPAASAVLPRAWLARGFRGEAILTRLAKRGDPRAFEAIFERYHQELYRYCRAIVGDPEQAQDALQSTMAKALRFLPGEGREIALRPWLFRVAHNEAISILRHRTHVDFDRLPEQQVAPGADSEAEDRERLRDLVADLDALPERQRGALVMRELSGLSYPQIGAALASSEGAARQAVYEARTALQELKAGRAMECEAVRRALSERDGRVLRGRRLRAHMRACEACQDFGTAISQRRADLQALCPPLPALAASGLLTTLLGQAGAGGVGAAAGAGAGGGAAGVAGVAGTSVVGSAAVKGASLVAAVVIGAGAMEMSGAVDLPGLGGKGASVTSKATPAPTGAEHHSATATRHAAGGKSLSNAPGSADEHGRARQGGARGGAGEHRSSASATHGNAPANGVGNAPWANGTPPEHSSAGGASHGNASASPPGLGNAASHAPSLPPQAQGKPGSPPGRDPAATRGSATREASAGTGESA